MRENRLGVLLGSFTNEDWKGYQKFARSRYSETSDSKLIIDFIKKHKDRYDAKNLDSEYLRKKIRPGAKPIVFANVISQLCKHIEAYFVWAEVMGDPMMEDTLLLKAFGKRGLTDQFHKQKKKAAIKREELPIGLWKHYHEFMGEYLDYYKRMTTDIAGSKLVLENCDNALNFFNSELQGYLDIEKHNRKKILRESWNLQFINQTPVKYFSLKNTDQIFNTLLILNEKRDWGSYKVLKQILYNRKLSIELAYTLISYLGSFLKWQNLNNNDEANQELVDLYTYGLEKDILFPNKVIPLNSYAIIIMVGANTGNYKWAEDFIKNYSHQVSDKNVDQIQTFGLAHLAYRKGEYEKAIELIRSKKFNSFILELKAKWVLFSSLYELNPNDLESYNYYTISIKSFIKRNQHKFLPDGSIAFLNSINFLNKLIKKNDILSLEREIVKEKKMIHKKWFLDKIKELQT